MICLLHFPKVHRKSLGANFFVRYNQCISAFVERHFHMGQCIQIFRSYYPGRSFCGPFRFSYYCTPSYRWTSQTRAYMRTFRTLPEITHRYVQILLIFTHFEVALEPAYHPSPLSCVLKSSLCAEPCLEDHWKFHSSGRPIIQTVLFSKRSAGVRINNYKAHISILQLQPDCPTHYCSFGLLMGDPFFGGTVQM